MGDLTLNRPKCLVSIDGRPMLYSISNAFGENIEVTVIGDYKANVLEKYIKEFPASFDISVVKTTDKGTSAGVQKAIELTRGENFILVWSDILFTESISTKDINHNTIGINNENYCRWSVHKGKIIEKPNNQNGRFGIPGVFFFTDPSKIGEVPRNGEFVRFLSESSIEFEFREINGIREVGSYESYRKERDRRFNSRFFNTIKIEDGKVVKSTRDPNFASLIEDEKNWYNFIENKNFAYAPKISSLEPLTLEYIQGIHPYNIYDTTSRSLPEREKLVRNLLESLEELHAISCTQYTREVVKEMYVGKTIARITKVSGVLQNNNANHFTVNGIKVNNLLKEENKKSIGAIVDKLIKSKKNFHVIHGDPTFSNILIRENNHSPIFIDPRGYFGNIKIYGDPLYDIAKLYYSAIGNYDFFNQGKFILKMNGTDVEVKVQSEGFEHTEKVFEEKYPDEIPAIKLLHSLIWLSLSGYVIDDYDAINASFFHGLRLFQEVWNEYS